MKAWKQLSAYCLARANANDARLRDYVRIGAGLEMGFGDGSALAVGFDVGAGLAVGGEVGGGVDVGLAVGVEAAVLCIVKSNCSYD